jgi:mannose-6-phosphate isomerase-like protein (cupin superfamily)
MVAAPEEAAMTHPTVTDATNGDILDLGTITLRLLAVAEQTHGAFAVGECSGEEGPWTVPHVHQHTDESFYVLDGAFTFTLGTDDVEAGPGSFIRVPRGTRHELRAGPGGGRLLTLWVPGGAEAMFVELSRMPPGSLRDPEVRKAISARFDSIPT